MRRYPLQPTFESRADLIIEQMAQKGIELQENYGGGKNGAYPAMALFASGEIEMGRKFVREQLTGGGAMFREFGTMSCFMKYGHLYGSALQKEVKDNQLHHSTVYDKSKRGKLPGASENHKLMYAAANYMGGLAWPDEYPEEWYKAGFEYLMNWYDQLVRIGFWEQDSPVYFIHHVSPILSVWEHAPDESEMKQKSKMVLDWYFATVAPEYLKGYWIATHARDKTPVHGVDLAEETTALLWLYFAVSGQRVPHPHPPAEQSPYRQWLVTAHFATSEYKPPSLIRKIAIDRDEPFVHKEFMKKNPMQPKDYVFMNQSYGLASTLAESGRIPPDMTRWKLQWVTNEIDREPSLFLLKHPDPKKDQWEDWLGASPYETVLQQKDALVAVYGIPEKDEHHFIDGPFKKSVYDRFIKKDGWWFFENESILFGAYVVNGLEITGEKRMAYQHFGKTAEVDVMRSEGKKNAVIVQTALPEMYPDDMNGTRLNAFAKDVIKKTKVEFKPGKGQFPMVVYKTLSGDALQIDENGNKTINGESLEVENWPMLGNPWMLQEMGEQILTITYKGEKLEYNFNDWTIR